MLRFLTTMEDPDDVVVEIDVFLNQRYEGKLDLFQYPLRPSWHGYSMSELDSIQLRPSDHSIKLELNRKTSDDNYNDDHEYQEPSFVLSSREVPHSTNYALGYFTKEGKELHLSPVSRVLQFRPDLSYVDKRAEMEDETLAKEEEEDQDKQIDFASSHLITPIVTHKEEETPPLKDTDYRPIAFHSSASKAAERARDGLISAGVGDLPNAVHPNAYLNALKPPTIRVTSSTSFVHTELTKAQLRAMSAEQQVLELLKRRHVMKFDMLRQLCTSARTPNDLLKTLKRHALLVHGVWVVSSRHVVSEHLIPFRNYLLLLFSKNTVVSRRKFIDATSLPAHETRELFCQLSEYKSGIGWVFQQKPDTHFITSYPSVVTSQKLQWINNSQLIIDKLKTAKIQLIEREAQKEEGVITPSLRTPSYLLSPSQRLSPVTLTDIAPLSETEGLSEDVSAREFQEEEQRGSSSTQIQTSEEKEEEEEEEEAASAGKATKKGVSHKTSKNRNTKKDEEIDEDATTDDDEEDDEEESEEEDSEDVIEVEPVELPKQEIIVPDHSKEPQEKKDAGKALLESVRDSLLGGATKPSKKKKIVKKKKKSGSL
ncbi:DNA-directed RNA polymerase III subunit Rpc5 like protein [Aduncisulcus paluster]|uniref:DNA-directed RNA polymerase III subunit Rpc5 like protein n=1 Tax=Aduncisulcus paluster TaxID=2918883 RepID=A0ABQ5JU06_9EUKA|nr:DNA-directed RNA polymerase III subunit Rpc5 like protein [Aduncisulcus paluster]